MLPQPPLTSINHQSLMIGPGMNQDMAPNFTTKTLSVTISNKAQVSKLVGMGMGQSGAKSTELTQALGIITNTVPTTRETVVQKKNNSLIQAKTNQSVRPKTQLL